MLLLIKKVTILVIYLNFINIFSKKLAIKLLKYSSINNYIIKVKIGQQLSYRLTYSLKFVKLKTFKTYIEINLANHFI